MKKHISMNVGGGRIRGWSKETWRKVLETNLRIKELTGGCKRSCNRRLVSWCIQQAQSYNIDEDIGANDDDVSLKLMIWH